MFFAIDEKGNRVNAEDGKYRNCICPACGNPVRQRRGDTNRHHFAHIRKEETCPFEYNKDYINMSEWHIRMQEYFPKEMREHIFLDEETGEKHIADVFIKEANTVLEFQHSSLNKKEFLDRTMFHLREGRRIAWLFDESWKNADEETDDKHYYTNGKLTKANKSGIVGPYKEKSYRWLYRRKYVEEGPQVYQPKYSVCVYTGAEGDVFHRIVKQCEERIVVSLHDIVMSKQLNVEELFAFEAYWQKQEPWVRMYPDGFENDFTPKNYRGTYYKGLDDFQRRRYDNYIDIEERLKRNREKEKNDREDYWKALLED